MSWACGDVCECRKGRALSSILYKLLQSEEPEPEPGRLSAVVSPGCACPSRRRLVLKWPHITCAEASAVLAKTLAFIQNVPCFHALPGGDQVTLVRRCWAPLLVLGLAQDKVNFETVEVTATSILHMILTSGPADTHKESEDLHTASAADIHTIKRFLNKCWTLDITPKEYAYLKGTLLFNPELPGLHCVGYIQSLQQEAHQALKEHVKSTCTQDQSRFFNLIIALSMVRCIGAGVIVELFFRPIGNDNIDDKLVDMLCVDNKAQAAEKIST
ncbi:nuclear receptor subfamily 0 group B member 1 [Amblyraja radiata]|uniref:nuclear receptor subfamily 0 group B member 1 n=1 Tax=Amblyraja radiata TaxID=386614 RepID=UPI001401CE04|nr:nuclear receptor subfamily 0 group B member 1 [Amblyraja radiata]